MRSVILLFSLRIVLAFPLFAARSSTTSASASTISHFDASSASPITSQYLYGGAQNDGLPGLGLGSILVPAPDDKAHQYQDPPSGAQRGPCPGMNVLANHGFISRDGIVTWSELVQGQQNVFNVGYDLAVLLATVGVALDGDIITEKVRSLATSNSWKSDYMFVAFNRRRRDISDCTPRLQSPGETRRSKHAQHLRSRLFPHSRRLLPLRRRRSFLQHNPLQNDDLHRRFHIIPFQPPLRRLRSLPLPRPEMETISC